MPIKEIPPTSPGKRFLTTLDFSELSKVAPERSLIEVRKKHAGRNNNGHITVRHRGGGTRKIYRIVDFKRGKDGIPAKVATIEYDPNRSCRIALLELSRRREAVYPRTARSANRRARRVGTERRYQDRQRAADSQHSGRHGHSQHRAATGTRR